MAIVSNKFLELAISNIANHGDTDIFPFPVDNLIFNDDKAGVLDVLRYLDSNFDEAKATNPILAVKNLSAVGYHGFRYGTQIDSIWNAYLLALVATIGVDIESKRVSKEVVFSYRYLPNLESHTLFDRSVGWTSFQNKSVEMARENQYVLRCDISDFYPRIYHHRLENALKKATENQEVVKRIMSILMDISEGVSYGLPVGGPAARLLSELLLNRVDRLLANEGIRYCRFVDDFNIFAATREEAYQHLITLNQLLLSNEGLSLQKIKTKIMTSAEFLSTSDFAIENVADSPEGIAARNFSKLRIHYDPYSPTAESEYLELVAEVSRFDVVGMLGRELAKSRLDEGLTRRLLAAIRLLPNTAVNQAIQTLQNSLDLLYPVFPSVMILCKGMIGDLSQDVKDQLFATLRELIKSGSYITQVPTNLAYALRVLAADPSEEMESLLSQMYKQPLPMNIKRDIILMMGYRGADHWISDCRKKFSTVTDWEKRALLICSYILSDEGSHWRTKIKRELSQFDKLVLSWAGTSKSTKGVNWKVPL
ncbi:RNA-directed DNA polymerase [Roseateles albus]|uniref:RNA-directed DNA polymerase n=1 Tax=Roseateles albus TaxID=2987525 RepID=A0ABT5K8L7_9BURK|nr:RNA-directed DNA polymerase [Roseateles albus]MDC8770125.1 RNA-directed DNA polymerase [Roseateles albus]